MRRSSAFYLVLITDFNSVFGLDYSKYKSSMIDYATRAERNATTPEKLYAPRGYIYDRMGV
jgi:cell division protein FtsI/penicillin-binding protein 2